MEVIDVIEGSVVPLWRAEVDTDQIMPKDFLKRTEKNGFGEYVFHELRKDPEFVLNDARYAGGQILVAGPNFGCGSSREHAPWGLYQYGFKAVIAPSFGDIFRSNCGQIGLLAVQLDDAVCHELATAAERQPGTTVGIDLVAQRVRYADVELTFEIDPYTKHLLVEGLDPIALTLQRGDRIAAFEGERPVWLPTTIGS